MDAHDEGHDHSGAAPDGNQEEKNQVLAAEGKKTGDGDDVGDDSGQQQNPPANDGEDASMAPVDQDEKGNRAEPQSKADDAEKASSSSATADDAKDRPSGGKDRPRASATSVRTVKKARSAYFIFAEERRPGVQADHPGEKMAVHAKILGRIWGEISPEEKEAYQLRAAEERERVSKEIQELRESGMLPENESQDGEGGGNQQDALALPLSRVKKIVKLDPEVKNVSREGMLMIARAAEMFTAKLGHESVKIAQIQNRRKIMPEDVAEVCTTREQMLFLREDMRDLVREQLEEKRSHQGTEGKQQQPIKGSEGSRTITSFFGSS